MTLYLKLNLIIISIPLLLSFDRNVRYYKKYKYVFAAMVPVSLAYIVWDIFATGAGHWHFNPLYVGNATIINLPLEEVLFFVTVPFSCLFIYEVLNFYLGEKALRFNPLLSKFFFIPFLVLALLFRNRPYTFIVMLSCAFFFILAAIFSRGMLRSRLYYLYILICFIPFFIFNYILTMKPVVEYGSEAITNLRVLTIPVEDFFYNFGMLSFYLLVYLKVKEKWKGK